ncbi:MAG TPA: DUF2339 domain-containing protein, partial [Tepidisphaeraceae bacterium]
MDDGLTRRLDAIERRLLDLERRLPIGPTPAPPEAPRDVAPMAVLPLTPIDPPADAVPREPAPAPRGPPPLPIRKWSGTFDERGYPLDVDDIVSDRPPAVTEQPAVTKQIVPTATPRPDRPTAPPRVEAFDLEQVLGLKWAGWIGAIVLVIGAALGIKYAYDQGWIGGVSDEVRCLLIAASGLGLIAAGEVVYRRVNRFSATGLYGAGVAVLFLAAYAGQAWYGLYAPATALLLMIFAAAAGIALAARADLVSVAALAVLGAGLCPAFFETHTNRPAFFPFYLLCLQAMAIGLCAWRATPKWWVLRGLALAVTTLWMLDDSAIAAGRFDSIGTMVAVVMAVVYQAELLYTTLRRSADERGGSRGGTVFSLLTTAALAAELMVRCARESADVRGYVLLALAIVAFALGRIGHRPALRRLARGFDLQGVLLLVVAVPVMLSGPAILFGWIALAAGVAGLAAMTRDRVAARAAAGVWLLAAIGTFVWADKQPGATAVWLHIGGEAVRAAVVVGAALAVVGHLAAYALHRLHPRPYREGHIDVTTGLVVDIAAVASLMAMLAEHASADFATRTGIGYGLALLAAAFVPGLETLGAVSTGLLAVMAVKWAAFDVLRPRLAPGWQPVGRPFWNAQAATGVVLAAAFGVAGWTHRRRAARFTNELGAQRVDRVWAAFFTVALIAIGFAASVEVDHAITLGRAAGGWTAWPEYTGHQLVWTMLWAGCVGLGWGTLTQTVSSEVVRRDVFRCVRGLAYVLAAKFVFVDVIGAALFGPTPVPRAVLNLQSLAAVVVIGLLLASGRDRRTRTHGGYGGLAVLAILLVCGSAEIDRYASQQADSPTWIVRQVGWSIYWATLAVLTLIVGFVVRHRPLR